MVYRGDRIEIEDCIIFRIIGSLFLKLYWVLFIIFFFGGNGKIIFDFIYNLFILESFKFGRNIVRSFVRNLIIFLFRLRLILLYLLGNMCDF